MPDASRSTLRLLVGGAGKVRFAIPLAVVERVCDWGDLPERRRVVNLPLLLDLPSAPEEGDRYARILGVDEPAYLRLGLSVRAVDVPVDQVIPMPRILSTAAARWSWEGLAVDESGDVLIVVDAPALVRIGAPRVGREGAAALSATVREVSS